MVLILYGNHKLEGLEFEHDFEYNKDDELVNKFWVQIE